MFKKDKKREFEKFYNKNIDRIHRFVFFRVGANRELAEDLVSEIFIKALNNFDSYDENISKSSWIFTIAKNHLSNYWRDKKPEQYFPDKEDGSGVWEDIFWKKNHAIDREQNIIKEDLYEFLETLEPKERENVTLHYLVGYSYAEIAEMKGSTESAVKVATHRAIKKIRNNSN